MRTILTECETEHSPDTLAERIHREPGRILLRSNYWDSADSRYSFVACRPFLGFRSRGSRCVLRGAGQSPRFNFGNPWSILNTLMSRYELPDEPDLPFPLGGCFGFWGYGLKNFVEPGLPALAVDDLELPDCQVGFHDSLVVFDHRMGKTWIISTGMTGEGSQCPHRQRGQLKFWQSHLQSAPPPGRDREPEPSPLHRPGDPAESAMSPSEFEAKVRRAQAYIRRGDIYQVNLSHRLSARFPGGGWELWRNLAAVSPAPFSGFLDCGDFQIVSSSPEQFLEISGQRIRTRPIKGTRPRGADPDQDARLAYELTTSAKETAELVMITDLLRNDIGKVSEFGSVRVPDLLRLEKFPQVQHLVSTVEGRLRDEVTHFDALASCFPGGSITGAPKIRAMEIIEELEPLQRGPYTGSLGYLGFNRQSQLSILIRTAICREGLAYFQVGAGIVADSDPHAEFEETLAKAEGFLLALQRPLVARNSRPPAR